VEIVAQPPGKKLGSLALLSGGERSLTAVALLFALLQANPSPICVLDEVDAALDEANVGRFVEELRALSQRTQFIIITTTAAPSRPRTRSTGYRWAPTTYRESSACDLPTLKRTCSTSWLDQKDRRAPIDVHSVPSEWPGVRTSPPLRQRIEWPDTRGHGHSTHLQADERDRRKDRASARTDAQGLVQRHIQPVRPREDR